MDRDVFWQMIGDARAKSGNDLEELVGILVTKLAEKPEIDILEFESIYRQVLAEAFTDDLWDVCIFITCISGESAFEDFRNWLITQGKECFYRTLQDPDSLAQIITNDNRYDAFCETLAYTASRALENKSGETINNITIPIVQLKPSSNQEMELSRKFPMLNNILGE